jgi:hypothetical protein
MMRARCNEPHQRPTSQAFLRDARLRDVAASKAALVILILTVCMSSTPLLAQGSFQLLAAPGGLRGTLVGNNYVNTFGAMNALGIGTPQTGLTLATLSNGALYFTPYIVQFSGLPNGHKASLTAYVSTNFAHPSALIIQNCPDTATCTSAGGFSAMSTSAAAPSVVVPAPGIGNNVNVNAGLGIFIPDNNGAGAFSGVDNGAVISFRMTDLSTNNVVATAIFTFTATPSTQVQTAVQLTLATAPGGLAVQPAGDYQMAFGNVNGLGIGPGAGLTTVAAAGGTIYSTPYLLQPVFSDFTSTTATLKVFTSTNFAHPTSLILEDAAVAAGPYSIISATAGTPTIMTGSAANRSTITRYLGLLVSNANGAGVFAGNDSATLTFTMTVP